MNDLRFAVRQVIKNPGFAALAVLTLALGIGASSTVFSLIQGVLLTPDVARTARRRSSGNTWARVEPLGF
jgi:hypothetical protein